MVLFFVVIGALLLIAVVLAGWLFSNAGRAEEAYYERQKLANPKIPDTLDAIDWGEARV